jgi:hypothetical protein
MLGPFILSGVKSYAECHFAGCLYAECRYAGRLYSECRWVLKFDRPGRMKPDKTC